MKELRLRMNMFGDDHLGTTRIMANLYPSDRGASVELRAKLRDFDIPAGDDFDTWKSISLPPGNYELQVSLPSGKLITKDIEIPSNTSTESIDVALESKSPHEWLAYQHFIGNAESRTKRVRSRTSKLETLTMKVGSSTVKYINFPFEGAVGATVSNGSDGSGGSIDSPNFADSISQLLTPSPFEVTQTNVRFGESAWDALVNAIETKSQPNLAALNFQNDLNPVHTFSMVTPYREDEFIQTYRFTLDGPVGDHNLSHTTRSAWDAQATDRVYILINNEETARLICAPLPWFDLSSGETKASFEVNSPRGDVDVTTAIRDTKLSSIIGYLTHNSLANARRLVDSAEGMLFHKFSNPLGATAGAYVMLATETERDSDANWHQWVINLYQNFPWIPDGAIAFATLKLNHQANDKDVEQALDGLLEAYHRGIPFYSIGMRWLLDGLTAFSEDDAFIHRRPEILACLRAVSIVARRTNYLQAFTNIEVTNNAH
jgi:hypothetical protein